MGGGVGYYNFPRSTNKIKSFDEISTSEKNYIFLQFSVVGEVKLNFRKFNLMKNQIFILRTPAAIKFFYQILKNCHFGVKKNHYPCRWICMTYIKAPTLFPRKILICQGVLTKFNF